jgi:hypothetical protein
MADNSALQIFPNFFLGEMWEISGLRAKKFGIVVFRNWRLLLGLGFHELAIAKNSLTRFRIFRNKLSLEA